MMNSHVPSAIIVLCKYPGPDVNDPTSSEPAKFV